MIAAATQHVSPWLAPGLIFMVLVILSIMGHYRRKREKRQK